MKTNPLFFIACVLLSITLGCATAHKPVKPGVPLENNPAVLSGVLDNGLTYHIMQNKYPENRIFLRLAVKIGSLMEAKNEQGLAHFVEHLGFNSSPHFAANELISYFESLGMALGPEVNAFTSFDETVYMLEIPADNPEALTASLQVIADWAGGLIFDPVIVEKERGVILEEWRLGRGYNGRIWEAMMPFLFPFSRYASRDPIGKTEVIRTAPQERIAKFYKKWYRPDLMSLVIVGDQDQVQLERAVAEHLSRIPKGTQKPKRPEYTLSPPKTKMSLYISDPEIPYTQVFLGTINRAMRFQSAEEYRLGILQELSQTILKARLQELVEDREGLEEADSFRAELTAVMSLNITRFAPKNGEFTQTFQVILDALDQFAQFGAAPGELERAKADLRSQFLDAWQNQDTLGSDWWADQLVWNALYQIPALSPDQKYRLESAALQTITLAEINQMIKQYYSDRGSRLVVITAPEAGTPKKKTLDQLWKGYQNPSLGPYQDTLDPRPLFPPDLAGSPGSIIEERILSPGAAGTQPITEWTLSNGAKVVVCPTNFKKDFFLFDAVSLGGLSLLEDPQYPSAKYVGYYAKKSGLNGFKETELAKKLAGIQVWAEPFLEDTAAGIQGQGAVRDLEKFFQLVNLSFTAPAFTKSGWNRTQRFVQEEIEILQKDPVSALEEALKRIRYSEGSRFTLPTQKFLEQMDPAQAAEAYSRFFRSPGDFTFIFTGDLDREQVKQLSIQYLASLPGNEEPREAQNRVPPFPQGTQTVRIRQGLDPLGVVSVNFGGENPAAEGDPLTEQALISAMTNLMEIRLRDRIREQLGATYGVYVQFTQENYPVRRYEGEISFGCDPERAEELAALVIRELRLLGESPVSGEELVKLRELFIRNRETSLKTNEFWQALILENYRRGEAGAQYSEVERVVSALTGETLNRMIRRYGNPDNYIMGILLPE